MKRYGEPGTELGRKVPTLWSQGPTPLQDAVADILGGLQPLNPIFGVFAIRWVYHKPPSIPTSI